MNLAQEDIPSISTHRKGSGLMSANIPFAAIDTSVFRVVSYRNLHLHTDASHLDGLNDIPNLIKRLKEINHDVCAITDHGNMHNALKFYQECINNGIKPLLGFEAYVFHDHKLQNIEDIRAVVAEHNDDFLALEHHLVLLAKNFKGYQNLMKLTSIGYVDGFYKRPHIDFELLKQHSEGVIVINGHIGTDFARAVERHCKPISALEKYLNGELVRFDRDEYIGRAFDAGFFEPHEDGYDFDVNDPEALFRAITSTPFMVELLIKEDKEEYARRELKRAYEINRKFLEVFGEDYYLEVQDHGLQIEQLVNPITFRIAKEQGIKVVATNDAHYTWKEDADAHRVHISNGIGKTLEEFFQADFEGFATCDEFYVKSDEDMSVALHRWGEDGLQALANTWEIVEKCNVEIPAIEFGGAKYDEKKGKMVGEWNTMKHLFPEFTVPAPYADATAYFKYLSRKGLEDRILDGECDLENFDVNTYTQRLEYEMEVIENMGFPTYFLMLWDVIDFCMRNDIPVGKGRGSGAGSLVCYSLRITDVDPLPYQLLFERFLNPARISLPDIDTDFCYERIGEVIDYVKEKYGADHVCIIGTFGTLGCKAVLKDVARVLDYPFDKINAITKQITDLDITVKKAIDKYDAIREVVENDKDLQRIVKIAMRLEGLQRHTSQHAAGVIISPFPLTELMPVKKTGDGTLVSQFDMNDCEILGFVKFDFLKLRTLTIIKHTTDSIERHTGDVVNINKIPFDDPKVYEEFQKGNTVGIFQFESDGMQRLLRGMKPKTMDDLSAANALYRPGPLDFKVEDENDPNYGKTMVEVYVDRANGTVPVVYEHPLLEQVQGETYGVFVFQEQVMKASVVLAGFTLSESDELRKVVGKKLMDKMPEQRDKFIRGCLNNPEFIKGCEEMNKEAGEVALKIWLQIETFGRYGFNRSHSTAYAILAYQSMYLKVNYPTHFMASVLTSWMGKKIEQIIPYLNEARSMGIKILPPDINHSTNKFEVSQDGKGVHFGLVGIQGVGERAVANILEVQKRHSVRSMVDFLLLTDSAVNKTVVTALIKCGAFDSLGFNRKTLLKAAEDLLALRSKAKSKITQNKKRTKPVADISIFFEPLYDYEVVGEEEFPFDELCEMERTLTGFYMAHHPLDGLVNFIRRKTNYSSTEINQGVFVGYEEDQMANMYSAEQVSDTLTPIYEKLPAGRTVIFGGFIKQAKEITIRKGWKTGKKMLSFIVEDAYQGDINCTAFVEEYANYRLTLQEGNVVQIRGHIDYYHDKAQVKVAEAATINRQVVEEFEAEEARRNGVIFNSNEDGYGQTFDQDAMYEELQKLNGEIAFHEETIEILGEDAHLISEVAEELTDMYKRKQKLEGLMK